MHRLIRDTHLLLGLISVLFVLTYAVSALQMAHRMRLTPRVADEDLAFPPGLEARPLAQQLMEQRGYRGEMGTPQAMPAGFRLNITRPGTNYTVTYNRNTGQAHVRRVTQEFLGMLNRLHHLNGLHHADGVLNAWGWALALVSVVLLAIGGTGVYLWYRIHAERVLGSILLAANLAVSLGILAVLRG